MDAWYDWYEHMNLYIRIFVCVYVYCICTLYMYVYLYCILYIVHCILYIIVYVCFIWYCLWILYMYILYTYIVYVYCICIQYIYTHMCFMYRNICCTIVDIVDIRSLMIPYQAMFLQNNEPGWNALSSHWSNSQVGLFKLKMGDSSPAYGHLREHDD